MIYNLWNLKLSYLDKLQRIIVIEILVLEKLELVV
jgi:hypothetical protein